MSNKERLDILLVNRGLFESREKAKAAIMAGLIFMDTTRIDKAGTKIPADANIMFYSVVDALAQRPALLSLY